MLSTTHHIRIAGATTLLALLALAAALTPAVAQETGRILGRVVDAETDHGIVGAHVSLPALGAAAISGEEGRFTMLAVPAGTHSLRVESLGYGPSEPQVTVRSGRTTTIDLALRPQVLELDALTVQAAVERGSAVAVIAGRRGSSQVVDAIGQEQIGRSADGDAAAVVGRSPGVTVVGGRYVYVRGLGERYGNATLNGAPLASPEPDRKVVPLDLIPSSFLESVVTAKTYSPNQPGDFAGGLVQLRTRGYPPFGLFRVSASGGWDTQSSLSQGLTYAGGDFDALGFDDGTRELPSIIARDRAVTGLNYTPAQLEQIGEALYPVWAAEPQELPVNRSLSIALGDEWLLGDAGRPFGLLVTGNYSNGYRNRPAEIERVFTSALLAEPRIDYVGQTTTHTVAIGGMLELGYEPAAGHSLTMSGVFNRSTDDQSRVLRGLNDDHDTNLENYRLQYLTQSMMSAQVRGEHELVPLGGATLEWRGDLRAAGRHEPNTRELLYAEGPDGVYRFENFITSGSVFHQDLGEFGWGGALDLTVPFGVRGESASLQVGATADLRTRDVYTRRLRFINSSLDQATRELGPNQILSAATIAPDSFQIQEATFPGDNYDAEQDVLAGYAMVELSPFDRLRVTAGARVEQATQRVDPLLLFGDSLNRLPPAQLDDRDVLPAINLTYALTPSVNLRLGASQTLGRPQFRELAPFGYADYAGGYYVRGNPILRRTSITNLDARWEWFPTLDGIVALSAFHKEFRNPIEVLVFQTGGEIGKTWFNASSAENYGVELELRSSLAFLTSALGSVSVNGNLTLVSSTVHTGGPVLAALGSGEPTRFTLVAEERPLQGLSPYVVNLGTTWVHPTWGTSATVLFNRFGERVESVGMQPLPSIYESARNSLDLVVQQPVGGQWAVEFDAERLLGSEIEYTQGGDLLRSWDQGRLFTLSVSWGAGQ